MRAAGDPSEEHPAHLEGGASSQGSDTTEAPERQSKSQGEEGAAPAKAHQSEKEKGSVRSTGKFLERGWGQMGEGGRQGQIRKGEDLILMVVGSHGSFQQERDSVGHLYGRSPLAEGYEA